MITANARATFGPGEPFKATTIDRRNLGPRDVLIAIQYTGICHSDIHYARSEWGPQHYPVIPGHEIAGIVTEVGSEVTKYTVGNRVGVGCMVDSCGECVNCDHGEEQYCLNGATFTYADVDRNGERTQGGYSTHIVVTEDFVLRIPDEIELGAAAPLLAPVSPRTRRCAIGVSVLARRWRLSASAGSATWLSSSPTPWALKSPCCLNH